MKIDEIKLQLASVLDISQIANIYMYGSRLWGSANEDSDIDLIIVVKNNLDSKKGIHIKGIDATVYGLNIFSEELAKMKFLPVITQINKSSVILETIHIKFKLDKILFQKSVDEEAARDRIMIEKMTNKGKITQAIRIQQHLDRMLTIAKSITV